MRKEILAVAAILATAAPAYAQQSISPPPAQNGGQIIRQPSGNNGASTGTVGSVGSPGPAYPSRLRDFNNPAASYPRLGTGTGSYRH
jgi:hypothetical protein